MLKEIIILGDIELGGGTLTDDFISDNALSTFILSLSYKEKAIDLVLNGDTFDFLKCPYIAHGKQHFPRHITEEISLTKLSSIYNAHAKVFEALKSFLKNKLHHVYFIIGNHDHDLFFHGVQQELKMMLGCKTRVTFTLAYEKHGVYAEHGHQYDILNKINPNDVFLKHEGKKILKFPWVSLVVISRFLDLKEEHPFLERIKPYPRLFEHHKPVVKKLSWRGITHFFQSLFYYPVRYYYDPTYNVPWDIVSEIAYRIRTVNWDIDKVVHVFKKEKKKLLRENKIYVFGHVHEKYVEVRKKRVIIHADTWRDEYFMDKRSKILTPKAKRYVHVTIDGEMLHWDLVTYPIARSVFHYTEVIKDEKKFLKIAAGEEGFKSGF
jgi:UDP-2,3-diacylglucosamine pyrophosphatase LpxH